MDWLIWPGRQLITPRTVRVAWPITSVWRGYPSCALEITGWI